MSHSQFAPELIQQNNDNHFQNEQEYLRKTNEEEQEIIRQQNEEEQKNIQQQNEEIAKKKEEAAKEAKRDNKFYQNLITFVLALGGIAITTGILVFVIKFFLMFATGAAVLIPTVMAFIEGLELYYAIKARYFAETDEDIAETNRKLFYSVVSFGFSLSIVVLALLAVLSTLATMSALSALSIFSFGSIPTSILIGVVVASIVFKIGEFVYEEYLKYKADPEHSIFNKFWGFIQKLLRKSICLVDDIPLLFMDVEKAAVPAIAGGAAPAAASTPVGLFALIGAGYFIFAMELIFSALGMYKAYFGTSLKDDIVNGCKELYENCFGKSVENADENQSENGDVLKEDSSDLSLDSNLQPQLQVQPQPQPQPQPQTQPQIQPKPSYAFNKNKRIQDIYDSMTNHFKQSYVPNSQTQPESGLRPQYKGAF